MYFFFLLLNSTTKHCKIQKKKITLQRRRSWGLQAQAEGCFCGRVKSCSTSKLRRAPHLTSQISQQEFKIIKTLRDIFLNTDSLDLKNVRYDKS